MSSTIRSVYDFFLWSERLYEIPEFLERFERFAPFLMMVNDGYTGRDESVHMIANDDVYWFYGVAKQPRIVVEDDRKRLFSIPEDHRDKIIPKTHDGREGPLMTIAEMVKSSEYSGFRFAEKTSHTVYAGPELGETYHMQHLTYADRYDAKSLILHTVLGDERYSSDTRAMSVFCRFGKDVVTVFKEYTFIPAYIPITIAVGVGMADKDEPELAFQRGSLDVKMKIEQSDHSNYSKVFKLLSDMLVFDREIVTNDYDMIHRIYYDTKLAARKEEIRKKKTRMNESLPPKTAPEINARPKDSKKFSGFRFRMTPKRPKHKNITKDGKSTIGKARAPDPPQITEESSSDEYEEIKESVSPFGTEPIGLRCAPIAEGVDTEAFLSDMVQNIKHKRIAPPSPQREPRPPKGHGRNPPPLGLRTAVTNQLPVPKRIIGPLRKPKRDVTPPGVAAARSVSTSQGPTTDIPHRTSGMPPSSSKSGTSPSECKSDNLISNEPTVVPSALKQNNETTEMKSKQMIGELQTLLKPSAVVGATPQRIPHPAQTAVVRPMPKSKPSQERISKVLMAYGKEDILKKDKMNKISQLDGVKTIQDIPKDMNKFTVEDVSRCLELLKLEEYVDTFQSCQIDGELLCCLDQSILMEDFALNSFQATKMAQFIKGWRCTYE